MKFLAPIIFLLIAVSLSAQQNKYEEWYFNTKDSLRIYVKESLSTTKDTVIVLHGGFGANHDYMLDAKKGLEGRFHFVNQRVANVMPKTVNWNYDYLDAMNKNGKITIINGEYDFMDFGSKTYSENIKNYPSIDLIIIANSGHNVWSDEPEHFKEELEKALSK